MTKNLVIIPTYKEKENIEAIINAVFALPREFEILIIDDNSPDGTADIVKNIQKKYPEKLHKKRFEFFRNWFIRLADSSKKLREVLVEVVEDGQQDADFVFVMAVHG